MVAGTGERSAPQRVRRRWRESAPVQPPTNLSGRLPGRGRLTERDLPDGRRSASQLEFEPTSAQLGINRPGKPASATMADGRLSGRLPCRDRLTERDLPDGRRSASQLEFEPTSAQLGMNRPGKPASGTMADGPTDPSSELRPSRRRWASVRPARCWDIGWPTGHAVAPAPASTASTGVSKPPGLRRPMLSLIGRTSVKRCPGGRVGAALESRALASGVPAREREFWCLRCGGWRPQRHWKLTSLRCARVSGRAGRGSAPNPGTLGRRASSDPACLNQSGVQSVGARSGSVRTQWGIDFRSAPRA